MNVHIHVSAQKHLRTFSELQYNTLYLCDDIPGALLLATYSHSGLPKVINLKNTMETWSDTHDRSSTLRFYEAPKGTIVNMSV